MKKHSQLWQLCIEKERRTAQPRICAQEALREQREKQTIIRMGQEA